MLTRKRTKKRKRTWPNTRTRTRNRRVTKISLRTRTKTRTIYKDKEWDTDIAEYKSKEKKRGTI